MEEGEKKSLSPVFELKWQSVTQEQANPQNHSRLLVKSLGATPPYPLSAQFSHEPSSHSQHTNCSNLLKKKKQSLFLQIMPILINP